MKRGKLVLVTGGARSGKSTFAEGMASTMGDWVTYVATAAAGDAEMAQRIAIHQARRPAHWETVEEPFKVAEIIEEKGRQARIILLDCLTLLLSNWLLAVTQGEEDDAGSLLLRKDRFDQLLEQATSLARKARDCPAHVIIVTNEVGWGLVPPSPLGRIYRDLAGRANQVIAGHSDEVHLVVSGLPIRLK